MLERMWACVLFSYVRYSTSYSASSIPPRPFHPRRLHEFFERNFELQQPDWSDDGHNMVACDDINCTRKHAVSRPTFPPQPPQRGEQGTLPSCSLNPGLDPSAASPLPTAGSREELINSATALVEKARAAIQILGMTPSVTSSATGMDAALLAAVASLRDASSSTTSVAASFLSEGFPGEVGSAYNPGSLTAASSAVVRPTSRQATGPLSGERCGVFEREMRLLRSRGYAWLAGPDRSDHCCEWRQSGPVVTFGTGGPWYCALPR